MRSRVFLFEETHLNISRLQKYGDITYVFHNDESRRPLRDMKLENQIISQLTRFLFNPELDYVAVVGHQLPLVVYLTAIVSIYGRVRTLCFDSVKQDYFERVMGQLSEKEFVEVA